MGLKRVCVRFRVAAANLLCRWFYGGEEAIGKLRGLHCRCHPEKVLWNPPPHAGRTPCDGARRNRLDAGRLAGIDLAARAWTSILLRDHGIHSRVDEKSERENRKGMAMNRNEVSRRGFLKASAASLAAVGVAGRMYAAGSDTIRIGIIGCGGQGTRDLVRCVKSTPGVQIAATGRSVRGSPAGVAPESRPRCPTR